MKVVVRVQVGRVNTLSSFGMTRADLGTMWHSLDSAVRNAVKTIQGLCTLCICRTAELEKYISYFESCAAPRLDKPRIANINSLTSLNVFV